MHVRLELQSHLIWTQGLCRYNDGKDPEEPMLDEGGPECKGRVLMRDSEDTKRQEERRRPLEDGGRGQGDIPTSPGRRGLPGSQELTAPPEAGKGAWTDSPSDLQKEPALRHLDFRLLASKTVRERTSAVLSP